MTLNRFIRLRPRLSSKPQSIAATGARWLHVMSISAAVCWAGSAWAAKPEIVIDPGGIDAAALQAVNQAVQTIAALAEDQDGGEAQRLRRRARDAAVTALATEGYFRPEVTLEAGTDIGGETWDITIEPGERAIIEDVLIEFNGAITGPAWTQRVKELRDAWPIEVGQPFRNAVWEDAKRDMLDSASRRDFATAYWADSIADVDTERARVRLHLTLDSGPAVHLGEVTVFGLKRVPEGLVERYVRYPAGERFDRGQLTDWQQELQGTAFFNGVKIDIDTQQLAGARVGPEVPPGVDGGGGALTDVTVPLNVEVTESRPRRMNIIFGIDDEAGLRAETVYRQNVVFGYPVAIETGLRLDKLRKLGYFDVHLPPTAGKGYRDSVGVLAEDSDIEDVKTKRLALGGTRLYTRRAGNRDSRAEYETRLGARIAAEEVGIQGIPSFRTNTATTTVEWTRRDVNDKYDPRDGTLLVVGAGLGTELDGGNQFGRLSLRAQRWWTIARRDVLTLRGEIGQLWARDLLRVPQDFSYRTGGARTVRGYRYLGLGRDVNGAVLGDRSLLVGSVEYTRFFDERFGAAVFADAGNVADSFKDMDLATSVGVGARVRTPAGPLNLDVAYAIRDSRLRLHFSLGIAF